MARSKVLLEDILEHLDRDDDANYGMAAGSDYLGLDRDSASFIKDIHLILSIKIN